MQQKYFVILFGLFVLLYSSCNKSEIKEDKTTSIELLKNFSKNYPQQKSERLKISEDILSENNNAETLSKIAFVHYNNDDYELASYYFKKSGEKYLADSLKRKYAEQMANLGVVYEIMGLYSNAVENYLKALKIFKKNNDKINTSKIYNNLGIVYQHFSKPQEALKNYHKSLSLLSKEDTFLLASRYNNIGTVYEESLNKYDSALFYYNKAYEIYKLKPNAENLPVIENNIAYIYLLINDLTKAEAYLKKSFNHYTALGLKEYLAKIYRNHAKLYLLKNEIENAKEKIKSSIKIAQKFSDKETELEATKILIEIYEKNDDFKNANIELKNYYKLKDKLTGIEQKIKLNGIETKYLVAEKEHKINILSLKNKVNTKKLWALWLFIIALVFMLVGLFLFFRLKQKQNKLSMLKMRRSIENYITQIEEVKEHNIELIKQKEDNIIEKVKKFGLTEREEKILILISKGYTNNEIAEQMFVSVNTIKTHTKNIFIKLDVRNRTEAAKKAQNQ